MLPHNSDRLGAVHGASDGSETKLRQEHKHRLYEERVVVNHDDTSVPLKRHYILQSLSGRDAGVRYMRARQTATGERRACCDHMRCPWPVRGGSARERRKSSRDRSRSPSSKGTNRPWPTSVPGRQRPAETGSPRLKIRSLRGVWVQVPP